MVFFFTSCNPGFTYYMGRDKFENEDLIKFMFPEDIWFHVDGLSSAHVYLRPIGEQPPVTVDSIPPEVLEECLQLVKRNSIDGCKLPAVQACWTPWSNLKKDGSMDVGQVGFKDTKMVRHRQVERNRDIIRRLEKSQVERELDLQAEKENHDREQRRKEQAERQVKMRQEAADKVKAAADKEQREYVTLMKRENMVDNKHIGMTAKEFESSFL